MDYSLFKSLKSNRGFNLIIVAISSTLLLVAVFGTYKLLLKGGDLNHSHELRTEMALIAKDVYGRLSCKKTLEQRTFEESDCSTDLWDQSGKPFFPLLQADGSPITKDYDGTQGTLGRVSLRSTCFLKTKRPSNVRQKCILIHAAIPDGGGGFRNDSLTKQELVWSPLVPFAACCDGTDELPPSPPSPAPSPGSCGGLQGVPACGYHLLEAKCSPTGARLLEYPPWDPNRSCDYYRRGEACMRSLCNQCAEKHETPTCSAETKAPGCCENFKNGCADPTPPPPGQYCQNPANVQCGIPCREEGQGPGSGCYRGTWFNIFNCENRICNNTVDGNPPVCPPGLSGPTLNQGGCYCWGLAPKKGSCGGLCRSVPGGWRDVTCGLMPAFPMGDEQLQACADGARALGLGGNLYSGTSNNPWVGHGVILNFWGYNNIRCNLDNNQIAMNYNGYCSSDMADFYNAQRICACQQDAPLGPKPMGK